MPILPQSVVVGCCLSEESVLRVCIDFFDQSKQGDASLELFGVHPRQAKDIIHSNTEIPTSNVHSMCNFDEVVPQAVVIIICLSLGVAADGIIYTVGRASESVNLRTDPPHVLKDC